MAVVGVVLAGGAGRRMGGDKALAQAGGVPLALRVLRVLAMVTEQQAVVAKPDTRLPPLPEGVAVWREPETPRHPRVGVVHALREAHGRAVLCCAVDLPLLDATTLLSLLEAGRGDAPCVVPVLDGRPEPLCALWRPAALELLEAQPAEASMRELVTALGAHRVVHTDPLPFTNVNTLADLAAYPNVKA